MQAWACFERLGMSGNVGDKAVDQSAAGAQVSEANWWDMEDAALDDRVVAASQNHLEKRDWNA